MEVEKLVENVKNGNKESFDELMKKYYKDIYNIARMKMRNEDDINDVIQETSIKAYKNINSLKDNNMFKYWMIRILINECNNIYIEKKRDKKLYERLLKNHEKESEIYYEDLDFDNDFNRLLLTLSNKERETIILYFKYEYTYKEIAYIRKESVNTIKSRINRAKKKIKNNIGESKIRIEVQKSFMIFAILILFIAGISFAIKMKNNYKRENQIIRNDVIVENNSKDFIYDNNIGIKLNHYLLNEDRLYLYILINSKEEKYIKSLKIKTSNGKELKINNIRYDFNNLNLNIENVYTEGIYIKSKDLIDIDNCDIVIEELQEKNSNNIVKGNWIIKIK